MPLAACAYYLTPDYLAGVSGRAQMINPLRVILSFTYCFPSLFIPTSAKLPATLP